MPLPLYNSQCIANTLNEAKRSDQMNIFKCAKCGKILSGFIPAHCRCGHIIPIVNGVYQFTDDVPIAVEEGSLKWLGYENVGANYRPEYFYDRDNEKFGRYTNLAEFMGEGKVILDVGAGLGVWAITMSLSGFHAIATDISQAMMAVAAERARRHSAPEDKLIFARMNGCKLELADNSIDGVMATDVLHQVDEPELMMSEILRVLKPDGYLIVHNSTSQGYTEEQNAENAIYNEACADIIKCYQDIIAEAGYSEPVFSRWERADKCIKESFETYKSIDDTGAHWCDNRRWPLKWGLHKTKTRAAGSTQLIPDDVHNSAWARTDEYAQSKYGADYESITKTFNYTNGTTLLKRI